MKNVSEEQVKNTVEKYVASMDDKNAQLDSEICLGGGGTL